MEEVIIIGAGGHAASVADIIITAGKYKITCFLEKDASEGKTLSGIPVVDESRLNTLTVKNVFVAIGNNHLRKALTEKLWADGYKTINAISPYAYISARASLGCGVAVMPHATISAGVSVEDGVIINTNTGVDHDCSLGRFCHIAPGSTLCGSVTIGEESFVCAGAKVIDKITIGAGCIVGAGAVVIRDVENGRKIVGVPAKPIGCGGLS